MCFPMQNRKLVLLHNNHFKAANTEHVSQPAHSAHSDFSCSGTGRFTLCSCRQCRWYKQKRQQYRKCWAYMLTPRYIMSSSVLHSSYRSLKNLPPENWYLMTSGLHKDIINSKRSKCFGLRHD